MKEAARRENSQAIRASRHRLLFQTPPGRIGPRPKPPTYNSWTTMILHNSFISLES